MIPRYSGQPANGLSHSSATNPPSSPSHTQGPIVIQKACLPIRLAAITMNAFSITYRKQQKLKDRSVHSLLTLVPIHL